LNDEARPSENVLATVKHTKKEKGMVEGGFKLLSMNFFLIITNYRLKPQEK
jgi:hypothetical protein